MLVNCVRQYGKSKLLRIKGMFGRWKKRELAKWPTSPSHLTSHLSWYSYYTLRLLKLLVDNATVSANTQNVVVYDDLL